MGGEIGGRRDVRLVESGGRLSKLVGDGRLSPKTGVRWEVGPQDRCEMGGWPQDKDPQDRCDMGGWPPRQV